MRFSLPAKRKMPSTSVANAPIRNDQSEAAFRMKRTFLFQVNTTFRDNYRHITVDVTLAFIVEQADGDVRVSYTMLKRYAKDALRQDCGGAVSLGSLGQRRGKASRKRAVAHNPESAVHRLLRGIYMRVGRWIDAIPCCCCCSGSFLSLRLKFFHQLANALFSSLSTWMGGTAGRGPYVFCCWAVVGAPACDILHVEDPAVATVVIDRVLIWLRVTTKVRTRARG